MKNAALISALFIVTLLLPACVSSSAPRFAAETEPGFRIDLQDADAPPPSDDATPVDDEEATDMVEVAMPDDSMTADAPKDDEWTFGIAPYVWAASLRGHMTVKGNRSKVDLSFGDILDATDFGFMFVGEARKGDTVWRLDQDYLALSDSGVAGPSKVSVNMELYIGTITAGQIIGDEPDSPEVFVGTRYWSLDAKTKVRTGGATVARLTEGQDWWDAIVGFRKPWILDENWKLILAGSAGGFGIGSSSKSSLGGTLAAVRETNAGNRFIAGWRHLTVDKSQGSGASKFEIDVRFTGPIFGWMFVF